MRKLTQFYLFKISTNRLKRSNYNINLTINEARKSGELITLSDSQMLRSLRKIKGQEISQDEINDFINTKRKIKNRKSSTENLKELIEIDKKLDEYLFIPEFISVFITDLREYEHIGRNGFIVNGTKYKRFITGAGQSRRNNSIWVSEKYEAQLKQILNNGRKDISINPSKYSAYFGLASSATLTVSTPYFCVVPDYVVTRTEKVDYITEVNGQDDLVEETEKELEFNIWDGQGLISVEYAKKLSEELELDYTPSAFIIRSNFIKGMVCTIDFHKFSEEVACNHYITDVWGNRVNVRDMDVILTQSQFKLWEAYDSIYDYQKKCRENDLGWGISRVTPKIENKYTFLNYQFIQVLDLNDSQIKDLCKQTVNYFKDITKNNIENTLLYLLGKLADQVEVSEVDKVFNRVQDKVTKALILNPKLLNDPYIKNHLLHSLNKKIKESYIGNLLIDGQYTIMIADPYAFMEYIFGMEIKGLLDRGEHYNKYWLNKKESKIAAMRAPLTYKSEVGLLNLKQNEEINEWFKYLNTCVIYNVFGNDCLVHGGSD